MLININTDLLGAKAQMIPATAAQLLQVVFHCSSNENALLQCSSSTTTGTCVNIASITCGGMIVLLL